MFEVLQFYKDHPVEFVEDVIGLSLDEWQKLTLLNLAENLLDTTLSQTDV